MTARLYGETKYITNCETFYIYIQREIELWSYKVINIAPRYTAYDSKNANKFFTSKAKAKADAMLRYGYFIPFSEWIYKKRNPSTTP